MLWTLSATEDLLGQNLTEVVSPVLYSIYHCVAHGSVAKITIKSQHALQKTLFVLIQMSLRSTTMAARWE